MLTRTFELTKKNIQKLFAHLDAQYPDSTTSININEYIHRLLLDLIVELAFDRELNSISNPHGDIARIMKEGVEAWMESFTFFFLYPPYWKLFPSKHAQQFVDRLGKLG